jgi:two-component system OmpR family response regulator
MLALDGGFDALLLDRMLPDLDGLSLLRSLRAAGVQSPAILLTAMSAIDERVAGLRAGADDYVVKPFSFAELSARLEAILRRPAEVRPEQTRLVCADLELDLIARTARRGGRRIELLPREFQMLEYLMRREGRVVTRTMLLEGLWDYRFDPGTNVIDVHISRLRRKIDAQGERPLIHTVRGAGYKLSATG